MKVSYKQLKQYVDIDLCPDEVRNLLTMSGTEVESVQEPPNLDGLLVAEIIEIKKHPNADKLSLCRINTGKKEITVVCGAKNMKEKDKVIFASAGMLLPNGVKLKKAKIRGIESEGMLCAEDELALGDDHVGIIILKPDAVPGKPVKDYLDLDVIFNFEITPNRPDCLSILGIAREISAVTGQKLKRLKISVSEIAKDVSSAASVKIEDREKCPFYTARIIEGVRVKPSPLWLQDELKKAGIRPVNNIVDVTNYVLVNMGQPLHAFDLNLLEGKQIVVRTAKKGEKIVSIDGLERKLSGDMLVIADKKRPVAVAGVMGGKNTEISEGTLNVLLESAYFNPVSIRRTSKKLNLSSESSHRFERGADRAMVVKALDKAAQIIAELAEGKVLKGILSEGEESGEKRVLKCKIQKANDLLGTNLSISEISDIFKRLDLKVLKEGKEHIEVNIPSFRVDLFHEADLIEEIARIYGYESIEELMPKSRLVDEGSYNKTDLLKRITSVVRSGGCSEIMSFSFIGKNELNDAGFEEKKAVKIQNPQSEELAYMRTTLFPGMMKALSYNINRGSKDAGFYELGRIFLNARDTDAGFREILTLGIIITGFRYESKWIEGTANVDFFDLKGMVENVLQSIGINECSFVSCDSGTFNRDKSAYMKIGSRIIGSLGELSSGLCSKYEIEQKVYYCEVDVDELIKKGSFVKKYVPVPKYPSVKRDVALILDEGITYNEVLEIARKNRADVVESIELFDLYRGKPIPKNKKSVGISITYRSRISTLTDKEVDELHKKLINGWTSSLKCGIRDY